MNFFRPISSSKGLSFSPLSSLADMQYSIVGDGEYVESLLMLIKASHGNMPVYIYVRKVNNKLPRSLQRLEAFIETDKPDNLVLGSNLFQMEIMQRLTPVLPIDTQFIDVLAGRGEEQTLGCYLNPAPVSSNYLLFFAVNPIENIKNYIGSFFNWVEEQGIQIVIRHPLQYIEQTELKNAKGILMWNGAMSVHSPILERCRASNIEVTFAECGFFPQRKYFYFDKSGINAASQLFQDDLSWVNQEHINNLSQVRQNFFENAPACSDEDFVFVPLQVPTDSNIINHSGYHNGMQQFIDEIESYYPNKQIFFKAHPKDRFSDSYVFNNGKLVNGDVIQWISKASLVHGINSSVLYEAALLGKPVIAEGESLLKKHQRNIDKLLAAMTYRQFSISEHRIDMNKLNQFTHFAHIFDDSRQVKIYASS